MLTIAHILEASRTIAIVGLSIKPQRASFGVAQYLQAHGYRILAVNPAYAGQQILGELCHASLTEAAAAIAPQRIDIVDCFRKASEILPVAQEAIRLKAGCLWLQLDIVHQEAAALAQAAGLAVVMDRCTKIEHAMLAR